ncbi:MAG: hypothetical protein GEV04_23255 [Actinophytocola sp.]|nr:hypothetical protein [Actinophytocola sp.]
MPPAAIGTLVFAGLLVVALAFTLIRVILLLRRILHTLGKVCFGVRAIALRTEPIAPAVGAVNEDLAAVADGLENLAAEAAADKAGARVS